MTVAWTAAPDGLRLLVELLIKSTVVLSVAMLLASLLRTKPASMRHFVLTFFLAGLLLLPALSSVRFGWETRLLPAPATAAVRSGPPTSGARAKPESDRRKSRPDAIALLGVRGLTDDLGGSLDRGDSLESAQPAPGRPAESATTAPETTAHRRFPWAAVCRGLGIAFLVVWPAGLALLLLRLALGLHGAFRLTREGETIRDPGWRMLLGRLLSLLGMRRSVRLKSHDHVIVPLTWGLARPVILIPAGHAGWTESRRSSILLHELSHVKRADFLTMMLVRLSLALFWFNPLVWVVFGRLKKDQERACDELVLRTGLKPSIYAANLLLFRTTAGLRWNPSAPLLGLFGRSSLNDRLAAILKQKLILKEVAMKTKIMLGIVSILAVSVIGTARPQAAPTAPANVATPAGLDEPELVQDPPKPVKPAPRTAVAVEAAVPEKAAPPSKQAPAPAQEAKPTPQAAAAKAAVPEKSTAPTPAAEAAPAQDKERTIVITTGDGRKVPIEITVVGAGDARTITVDKALVLKRNEKGELVLIGPEGREFGVIEGDPIRLRIEDGRIEVLEGGRTLRTFEGGTLRVFTEKGKERTVWTVTEPEKESEGEPRTVTFIGQDAAEGEIRIKIQPGKEAVWVAEGLKGRAVRVGEVKGHAVAAVEATVAGAVAAEKAKEPGAAAAAEAVGPRGTVGVYYGKATPQASARAAAGFKPGFTWAVSDEVESIRAKVEELRSMLDKVKAKEIELAELEKALDEMAAELKEREAGLTEVRTLGKHRAFGVLGRADESKPVVSVVVGKGDASRTVVVRTTNKGAFSLSIAADVAEMSLETYERIVESVRKELPEGYEIESDFEADVDEKSGVVTLKIRGPEDKPGLSTELAEKLAEVLMAAIGKSPAA